MQSIVHALCCIHFIEPHRNAYDVRNFSIRSFFSVGKLAKWNGKSWHTLKMFSKSPFNVHVLCTKFFVVWLSFHRCHWLFDNVIFLANYLTIAKDLNLNSWQWMIRMNGVGNKCDLRSQHLMSYYHRLSNNLNIKQFYFHFYHAWGLKVPWR